MKSIKIKNITIISRTIAVLVCLSTLSGATDVSSYLWENYVNDSLSGLCKDNIISLNFANINIGTIDSDFISSPFITCLNLTGNYINFAQDAFRKLPNLTTLFLSKSGCRSDVFLDGHKNLRVFVMNNCKRNIPDNYSPYYNTPSYHQYSHRYYSNERSPIQTVNINGNYQNLEILSLRNNNIKSLQYFLSSHQSYDLITPNLQNNPFPKLRILDLSKNIIQNFTLVTLLPEHGLSFLDLHENSLQSLQLHEKGEDVYTLILDNNKIEYVAWQSAKSSLDLIGMKSLTYLSISNNRINDIQSNAFKDTHKLEFLNLSANVIETLYQYTFANLNYLQTVDLSFNQIKNLTTQLSNEPSNISTLFLHHNKLNKILSNTFIQFPKLKKLFLGENDIEWIDTDAFAQLSMLEELNLSNNKLSFLPEGWSESLISLKYLNLNENNFTSLDSLSLTNIIPLTQLHLINNSLEYLSNGIFKQYVEYLPENLTIHLLN